MFSTSQVAQWLVNRTVVSAPKAVELSPGQVFQGTVLKRYPDNTALVQIGGLQLRARLEAELEPGQKAWLQVQPSSDVITLKVLQAGQPGTVQEVNLEGLLRSLGVADTKEMRALLQALLAANVPVSRELAEAAHSVFQRVGMSGSALDALLLAVKRNLPLTADTVTALQAFLSKKPFGQVVQDFLQQAESFLRAGQTAASTARQGSDAQAADGPAIGHGLHQLVAQLKEKVGNLPLLLTGTAPAEQQPPHPLAATKPNDAAAPGSTASAGQSAATEKQATAAQPAEQQGVAKATVSGENATADPASPSVRSGATKQVTPIVARANETATTGAFETPQLTQPREGHPGTGTTVRTQPSQLDPVFQPVHEKEPLPARLAQPEPSAKQASPHAGATEFPASAVQQGSVRPAEHANPILELFRRLGLDHERQLAGQALSGGQAEQIASWQADNVKSLLVTLTQAPAHAVPAGLREAAEALLQHVTGQQLMLVQPSSHTISQLVMQIPIHTPQGNDTAFVQIEAKKQASGQLDPENCRLFFHLTLQQLGTTLVDVNIVSRIVNVQIYNNLPWVEDLAQQMKEGFAQQLREAGYQLSGMRVKKIPEARGENMKNPAKTPAFSAYKGVDIRI